LSKKQEKQKEIKTMKLQDTSNKTNVITSQAQPTAPPLIASPQKVGVAISTLIVLLAALLLTSPASAATIYVDGDANGDANGSSWCDAYTDLQTALDNANPYDGIWVAQGTYHPNDADPNQESFDLSLLVYLYGGYAGCGEPDPNQRDWVNFVTILSGENTASYNVVDANNVATTISGFTVTGSYWYGINLRNESWITVNHCVITETSRAIYFGEDDLLRVTDCSIYDNWEGIFGAGHEELLVVQNCEIRDNAGDAIVFGGSPPWDCNNVRIKNNLIHHNYGGIISYGADSQVIRNNTIVDNGEYGVTNGAYGTLALSNCIIWGNYDDATHPYSGPFAMTYSCIDDSNFVSGPNNTIGDDPCFMHRFDFTDKTTGHGGPNTIYVDDASRYNDSPAHVIEYDNDGVPRTVTAVDDTNDIVTFQPDRDANTTLGTLIHNWGVGETDVNENYHLRNDSCCVDAGDPCHSYTGETDIDGDDRVMNGDCNDPCIVDIGADELKGCWNCDSQCYGDGNCDDQVNLTDLFILNGAFGSSEGAPDYDYCADFSRDGSVNLSDLFIVKQYWGTDPNNDCTCVP
jgi:parallel beta-helix repeat protein